VSKKATKKVGDAFIYEVKTASGVYKIAKPKERIGAKHLAVFLKLSKIAKEYSVAGMSPEDVVADDRFMELYERWVAEVLPHIVVETPDGIKPSEIPYDDAWLIFNKMLDTISFPDVESFQ